MYSFQGVDLVAFVLACMLVGMVGRWVLMGELPVIWAALKILVGRRSDKDMYSFRNRELSSLLLVFVVLGVYIAWGVLEVVPLLWEIVKPWIDGVMR